MRQVPIKSFFDFYQMGYSTYFNDDETVLMDANAPMRNMPQNYDLRDYGQKTNDSSIYKVKRGQKELGMPMFTEFTLSWNPRMDKYENIYFTAWGLGWSEKPKIRKLTSNGEIVKWNAMQDVFYTDKEVRNYTISVSKDGSRIVSALDMKDSSTLGILDTQTSKWSEITLPKTSQTIQTNLKQSKSNR